MPDDADYTAPILTRVHYLDLDFAGVLPRADDPYRITAPIDRHTRSQRRKREHEYRYYQDKRHGTAHDDGR